ncbi:MAG: hypothetical protein AB7H93_00880 [Vicinamibacterales bacterium]
MRDPNLLAGWISMLAGVLSGAAIGLFFHREHWLGGYGSLPRRMVRLGHISFFGIGFLNILFALTVASAPLPAPHLTVASYGLLGANLAMPATCFLTAWRAPMRHLFPVPVTAVAVAIASMLLGWGGR